MADVKSSRMIDRMALTCLRACRFVYRDAASAWLMLRMAVWVAILTLLMRMLPLPRILRMLTPRVRRHPAPFPAAVQARLARLIDMVLNTDFLFFTPTCWKRAPVLHRYLALNGIETRIMFGVRQGDGGLLAGHAWLESPGGQPLLETVAPKYTVTYSFPP